MPSHADIIAAETAERDAFGAALIAGNPIDDAEQLAHYRKWSTYYASIGDYSNAIDRARTALGLVVLIPDSEMRGLSSFTWDRQAIEASISQWQQAAQEDADSNADNGGLQISEVEYTGYRGGNAC